MASKHISHAGSPIKALYTIFVQPTLSTNRQRLARNLPAVQQHQRLTTQTRSFTCTPRPSAAAAAAATPGGATAGNKRAARAPEVRTQKWNEEITARILQLVDPETKTLGERVTRYDVLRDLDQKTHRLVQLTPDDPDNRHFVPVCKIVSKKEAYETEKKKKTAQKEVKQAAAKERSVKILELNWAIDGNDLAHRLEKVRGFLEEGRRVEVVLASKKRGRKATMAECEGLLGRIREVADGVGGAKVLKGFEGKMGGFATVVYQGRAPGVVVGGGGSGGKAASAGGAAGAGAAKKEEVEAGVEA
jgi:translation initiation factor IF-3